MHTKVLNLVQRDGLILGRTFILRLVTLRVRPKGSQVDLASRYSPDGVYHNCHKRVLKESIDVSSILVLLIYECFLVMTNEVEKSP